MSLDKEKEKSAVILYDADCGFCKWGVDKILAWDRRRVLRSVAIQSDEGAQLLAGTPKSEWLASWHLAMPTGAVLSGGAAMAPLARMLPGGKPLAVLFRTFPRLTDRAYDYVATHRDRFARLLRIKAGRKLRR